MGWHCMGGMKGIHKIITSEDEGHMAWIAYDIFPLLVTSTARFTRYPTNRSLLLYDISIVFLQAVTSRYQ
jgi:hypothetical protein